MSEIVFMSVGAQGVKTEAKVKVEEVAHPCAQCGKEMGNERFLGAVCGKCCRKNHREVIGK